MKRKSVAPNKAEAGPLRPIVKQYYQFLLDEELREAAAKRGICIVDEDEPRARPRLVADNVGEVLPLKAAERSEAE
jgi:hypothetical protein